MPLLHPQKKLFSDIPTTDGHFPLAESHGSGTTAFSLLTHSFFPSAQWPQDPAALPLPSVAESPSRACTRLSSLFHSSVVSSLGLLVTCSEGKTNLKQQHIKPTIMRIAQEIPNTHTHRILTLG